MRPARGTDLRHQHGQPVVIVVLDLDVAGFEPALDKSCGGNELLGPRGVVGDQPLGQNSFVDHPPDQWLRRALEPSAMTRNRSSRSLSRSATRRRSLSSPADSSSCSASRSRSRSSEALSSPGLMGLLDEDQRAVVGDLQVALGLGEADDLGLGLVQTQLGRVEHRQQRRVVGEDADRAHRRAGRDHLDLVVEDLALGGEDLDRELRWAISRSELSSVVAPRRIRLASLCPRLGLRPRRLSAVSPSPPRLLTTSSIVPFRKKARSGRSSCLPSRISLKPRIDSSIGHVHARRAGELLGHEERLRQEALDLARAADRQPVLVGQLLDPEDRDDVLQVLVALEHLLDLGWRP